MCPEQTDKQLPWASPEGDRERERERERKRERERENREREEGRERGEEPQMMNNKDGRTGVKR